MFSWLSLRLCMVSVIHPSACLFIYLFVKVFGRLLFFLFIVSATYFSLLYFVNYSGHRSDKHPLDLNKGNIG